MEAATIRWLPDGGARLGVVIAALLLPPIIGQEEES